MKNWIYQPYEKDQIVEYKGKYYIAVEEKNVVEPNDITASWLYVIFYLHFFFQLLLIYIYNINKILVPVY